MKIIQQIDEDTFVISLKGEDRKKDVVDRIIVAHDYVRFRSTDCLSTAGGGMPTLYGPHAFCANNISIPVDCTIDIKAMQNIVLPFLQKHKYLQPEHLADRVHTEDDTMWNSKANEGKYTKPRYLKGDKYPAYSFNTQIIGYRDEEKGEMVAFSLQGTKHFTHVPVNIFNDFILPNLNKRP